MLIFALLSALAILYAKERKNRKLAEVNKTDASYTTAEVDPKRHAAGLNVKNMYKGDRVVLAKLKSGESPYSGVTRGMAPRAPNLFLHPVRKEDSRIDWRKPSNQMFTTPEYVSARKRFYQMVYGTPRVEARQGGLDVGYGHMAMRGNPIHQGHIQHWLSMTPGQRSSPSMVGSGSEPNYLVNQRDLDIWLSKP